MNARPDVRRPRVRERVDTREYPNLKQHGKMVERPLLDLLASLVKKRGESFASEAGLRRMICQNIGHMPGVDTIPQALERLEARGIVVQRWLRPGGELPDGTPCTRGTRLLWLPQIRGERDRQRILARNRRETVTGRPDRRAAQSLRQARASVGRVLAPETPRDGSLARARDRELGRLRDLEAQWAQAAPTDPDKPPK